MNTDTELYNSVIKTGSKCEIMYDKIKKIVEFKQGNLISTKYNNARTPMEVKCKVPSHPQFKMIPSSILQGHYCKHCAIESCKYTDDEIAKRIFKYGWIFVDTEYKTVSGKDQRHIIFRKCNNKDHTTWSISFMTLNYVERRNRLETGIKYNTKPCPDCILI